MVTNSSPSRPPISAAWLAISSALATPLSPFRDATAPPRWSAVLAMKAELVRVLPSRSGAPPQPATGSKRFEAVGHEKEGGAVGDDLGHAVE